MAKAANIKKSLEEQLIAKGADVELYRALIDDYMWFYQQFRMMQADIRKRGRVYTTTSAQGKDYEKNNPSVKEEASRKRNSITVYINVDCHELDEAKEKLLELETLIDQVSEKAKSLGIRISACTERN